MNRNIRFGLISIFLLLTFFQAFAQQEEESSIADWYQDLTEKRSKRAIEKVLKDNADKLLAAVEIQDDSAKVFILLERGFVYQGRKYDYDSALVYFLQALDIADSKNIAVGEGFSYLVIARAFSEVGNGKKSLEFLQTALRIAGTQQDYALRILVLNELGKVNGLINEVEEALENFNQALSYKELKYKPRLEAEVLYNLAVLHETLKEYPKALEYQKKALALRRSIGDKLIEGFLLNEIGEVYQQMNNQERALANFNAALDVYQNIDEKEGIADSHNNIGVLYYQQNNFKEAITNFVLALPAGLTSQNDRPVQKSYEYLSLAYKAQGDFKQALEYKELLISLNEFQRKEINEQMLLERQSMYVVGKNEDQILKLESIRKERERELAEQKRIQLFLYAFIGLGVIVVVLILYLYLLKRRSNQQLKTINAKVAAQNIELQNLNATKDKFFSIIGHDLKGPLNSLTSFSNLLINYFDSLSKEEIQSLAKDLDKSLKNLYSLLNNLLEWARSQTGAIDFASEQFDISEVLHENHELLNAQANTKQITILHENGDPLHVIAHKQSITTVVRNLISNSIKFTPEGGAIRLSAIQMNTEIIVSITDNGVGMSAEVIEKLFRIDAKHSTMGTANEKGTGLGLILCKDFVEKNGGRLWVTSEEGKGSVFYFTLPVAPTT